MHFVYVSKMHSVIYKDASVGILLVEDGVLKNARQLQRFNISSSNLDIDILNEISMLTENVDFFVMYMKTKLPDDFESFIKRTSITNRTKNGRILVDSWKKIKGKVVWHRETPTKREDRAWISIASKLSKFTKEGMIGDKALEYFISNYAKSFKTICNDMVYLKDVEQEDEKEKKRKISEMKRKNLIFVISRDTPRGIEPIFATYDESVANSFMSIMFDYFTKVKNAKDIFAIILNKSGMSKFNARSSVSEKALMEFGLSNEDWSELCRNTFNGESDKFYCQKIYIK